MLQDRLMWAALTGGTTALAALAVLAGVAAIEPVAVPPPDTFAALVVRLTEALDDVPPLAAAPTDIGRAQTAAEFAATVRAALETTLPAVRPGGQPVEVATEYTEGWATASGLLNAPITTWRFEPPD